MELRITGTVDELAAFVDAVLEKLGLETAKKAGTWSVKDDGMTVTPEQLNAVANRAVSEPERKNYVMRKKRPMSCVTIYTAYDAEDGKIIMEDYDRLMVERSAREFEEMVENCQVKMYARTLFEDGTEVMEYSDGNRHTSQGHVDDWQRAKQEAPHMVKQRDKDIRVF